MAGENPVKPLYLPVNVIAQIFCPTNSATDSGNTIPARRSTFAPSREVRSNIFLYYQFKL